MRNLKYISLVVIALVLVACGTTTSSTNQARKVSLTNTSWKLSESLRGSVPTIMFMDGTMHGNAGCNTYNSEVNVNPKTGTVKIGSIATTRMMCENMDAEQTYLKILRQVDRYDVQNGRLHLYDGNVLLLKFERK